MLEATKGFRRLKGCKQVPLLKAALAERKAKTIPPNEHLVQNGQGRITFITATRSAAFK
jgi:hypothetical protein